MHHFFDPLEVPLIKRPLSLFLLLCCSLSVFAEVPSASHLVVFEQPGFPVVDTAELSSALLHRELPDAAFSSAADLESRLAEPETKLLILPYGSAFPEQQWTAIHIFLLRGGNLLTLGGRPFTRPVRFEEGRWKLLPETYAFARQLLISDYQETAGSSQTTPQGSADDSIAGIEALRWERAYSMVIRLSQKEGSPRIGASGTYDAELKTLLWGSHEQIHRAAPVVEIDHFQNNYAGGRWVMVNCRIDVASLSSTLIVALAHRASVGAELLRVTPSYPLYLAEEPWQLELHWRRFQQPAVPAQALITVERDGRQEITRSVNLSTHTWPVDETINLPTSGQPGFHAVVVRLHCDDQECGTYRTGFWIRNRAWLDAGPKVSADHNYFLVDGKRIEVVGTTYMSSDAQRLYFRYPNPWVWDQDMKQITGAGINMLRSGLWTDWDLITDDGVATEQSLRTLEAYLMTARQHRLPVQFTLFSFMPEVFGGKNPYLDEEALRREHAFAASIAQRFSDVPFLIWDLINEPSFDNPKRFFGTHPNHDAVESSRWTEWLLSHYGSRDGIGETWHTLLPPGPIAAPDDADMTARSANDGDVPLSVYDFNLFAQQSFAAWAEGMRNAIRTAGSQQLITVGQDEGGGLASPSPAFFAHAVDFTTTHSWWFNDDLLWDSLAARQQGLPMLVQETGVMTETNADARPRRNQWQDAALLEKKIGMALDTGAGAIEWLWNINAIMRSQQEVTIGAVRPDGTEKPEADVLRTYASFANAIQGNLQNPEPEPVAILTSQAEQFSVLREMATEAQHRAVRTLNQQCRIAARMVAENHVADIAGSQLTVLPSAQMLQDSTWDSLLDYVRGGGNLLLTGPIDRDEHWQRRERLHDIGLSATSGSLLYRSTSIQLGTETVQATFPIAAQQTLETLHFPDGKSLGEVVYGKGRIFVVDAPIELAESPNVTEQVYGYVLSQLQIRPQFQAPGLPSSILVRPRVFADSVLYLIASESSEDQDVNLLDERSGARVRMQLPALRTAMVLVSRIAGKVIASYQPPAWRQP